MTKIDTEDRYVWVHEVSVTEARSPDDGNEPLLSRIVEWLDEAQGPVFMGDAPASYLVIKLVKDHG